MAESVKVDTNKRVLGGKGALATPEGAPQHVSTDADWTVLPDPTLFTFASATTFDVATLTATDYFQRSDRFRIKQSGVLKYFYCTGVNSTSPNNFVTIQGGDVELANEAIEELAFSRVITPQGMSESLDYTTVMTLDAGSASITSQDFEFIVIGNLLILSVNIAIGVVGGGNPARLSFTLPFDYLKVPPAALPSSAFNIPVYFIDTNAVNTLGQITIDSDNAGRFDLTLQDGSTFNGDTPYTFGMTFTVAYV